MNKSKVTRESLENDSSYYSNSNVHGFYNKIPINSSSIIEFPINHKILWDREIISTPIFKVADQVLPEVFINSLGIRNLLYQLHTGSDSSNEFYINLIHYSMLSVNDKDSFLSRPNCKNIQFLFLIHQLKNSASITSSNNSLTVPIYKEDDKRTPNYSFSSDSTV